MATATIAVLAPWALMMPPGVAYSAALRLVLLAFIRGRQAWRVLLPAQHAQAAHLSVAGDEEYSADGSCIVY